MIEIILVLVILGILSCITVPKYFDLQDQAIEKKCIYNQSVLLESLYTQDAAYKLNNIDDYDFQETFNQTLKDISKNSDCSLNNVCQDLCPVGTYSITVNNTTKTRVFDVSCSVHSKHTNHDNKTNITANNVKSLLDWLVENYDKNITGVTGNDKLDFTSIEKFFTTWANGTLDSEANGKFNDKDNYGVYQSMTDAINNALSEIMDTDKVIWKITRTGYCTSGPVTCDWHSTMTLTIVDVDKNNLSNNQSVKGKQYTIDIINKPNHNGVAGEVDSIIANQDGVDFNGTLVADHDQSGKLYYRIK